MEFIFFSLFPLLFLIGVIVLIGKMSNFSNRLARLEREVTKLAAAGRAAEAPAHTVAAPAIQTPAHAPAAPAIPPPSPVHRAEPQPSRTREEWEQLIGGKVLNRIGALALTIGLGSFLKYAFDNNWIGEGVRVMIGALIGLLCLAGGYRTNRRGFQIFAQGLVGAGVSILYLSVYAAFNFYALVPQWAAFALMSLVTLAAFLNALYYDSQAEAILGWAGGFLTPLLLSTGSANEAALFTYIALLDAGLIAVMVRKPDWIALEPLTMLATWIMFQEWFQGYYHSSALLPTVFFATIFWALFVALETVRSRSARFAAPPFQIVPALNAAFYFFALYFSIDPYFHAWMGLVTLWLAMIYAFIFLQRARSGQSGDGVNLRYGLTMLTLVVVATEIQTTGFDTVMLWSVEAAALMWASRRWSLPHAETGALVIFGIAGFKLCFLIDTAFAYAPITDFIPILNRRAAAFAVLAASLGTGALCIGPAKTERQRTILTALNYGWMLALFLVLGAETRDFFQKDIVLASKPAALALSHEPLDRLSNLQQMSLSGVWLLYSAALMALGLSMKSRDMRIAAITLFGISILKIFIYDLSFLGTLYRIFSFMALGLILLAVSYAYQKYKDVILGKNIAA